MKINQNSSCTTLATIFIMASITIVSFSVRGQGLNSNWRQALNSSMEQFQDCQQQSANKGADCYRYAGESLNRVYKVNDFYSQSLGRFLMPGEISQFLTNTTTWKQLGHSYDQNTLSKAQEYANAGKAVVAVYMNDAGIGHVVLITPGQLQSSGSWGLRVPNVTSFFPSQPDKSFVDKGLSFAFGKNLMKDIVIYVRNY